MKPYYEQGGITLYHGDCRSVLAELPEGSIDAIVTDPPYALTSGNGKGFMGKAWDGALPPVEVWREVLRVAKPGAHLLAFGGTRTYHRLACAIEDAGWEIRDSIMWLYGQGFPKSLNVSAAIDKMAGAEREVVGIPVRPDGTTRPNMQNWSDRSSVAYAQDEWTTTKLNESMSRVTAPATEAAQQWSGFGTALKPAWEPIIVARKPLNGTVAANVQAHGTGAINIDACRIPTAEICGPPASRRREDRENWRFASGGSGDGATSPLGRWPPNLLLQHHFACRPCGTRRVKSDGHHPAHRNGAGLWSGEGGGLNGHGAPERYMGADGLETIAAWQCHEQCAIRLLDEQAGERKSGHLKAGTKRTTEGGYSGGFPEVAALRDYGGDSGTASRFFPQFAWEADDFFPAFYCPKASRGERNAGLEGMPNRDSSHSTCVPSVAAVMKCTDCQRSLGMTHRGPCPRCGGTEVHRAPAKMDGSGTDHCPTMVNHHPTVKPIKLCEWLVRLVCPPGGLVLDPFLGSGTTGLACSRQGFRFTGIELEAEYLEIARERLAGARERTPVNGCSHTSNSDSDTEESCSESAARRLAQGVFDWGDGDAPDPTPHPTGQVTHGCI